MRYSFCYSGDQDRKAFLPRAAKRFRVAEIAGSFACACRRTGGAKPPGVRWRRASLARGGVSARPPAILPILPGQYCHRLALRHPRRAKLWPGFRSVARDGFGPGRPVRAEIGCPRHAGPGLPRGRETPFDKTQVQRTPSPDGDKLIALVPRRIRAGSSHARKSNVNRKLTSRARVGARSASRWQYCQAVSAVLPEVARRASSRARLAHRTRLARKSSRAQRPARAGIERGTTERSTSESSHARRPCRRPTA